MSRLVINTSTPNSGDGDTIHAAFTKVNLNFQELYALGFKGWIFVSSDYNAENGDRIIADTSGGAFSITLPEDPEQGYFVEIADGADFSEHNLTLKSAAPVEGFEEDVVINIQGLSLEFVYVNNSWEILTTLGVKGDRGEKGEPGDAADRIVKETAEATLSSDGTLTLPGSIIHDTASPTGGTEPIALDLTVSVQKLANGTYSLADGAEGQMIYLVPRPGTDYNEVTVIVDHGRSVTITGSYDFTGVNFLPFINSTELKLDNVITLIFTDGAWLASDGEWEEIV